MSLENENQGQQASSPANIDVLAHLDNVDLTGIDRSRPIIKAGTYPVRITTIEVKETKPTAKNPAGGHRLAISLACETKVETDENVLLNPGFVLYDSISLSPTEKYNPLERLADIQLATAGVQTKGFKPADYIGQVALIKVKIEESDEYGKQNRVARWVPKKDPTKAATGTGVGSSTGFW